MDMDFTFKNIAILLAVQVLAAKASSWIIQLIVFLYIRITDPDVQQQLLLQNQQEVPPIQLKQYKKTGKGKKNTKPQARENKQPAKQSQQAKSDKQQPQVKPQHQIKQEPQVKPKSVKQVKPEPVVKKEVKKQLIKAMTKQDNEYQYSKEDLLQLLLQEEDKKELMEDILKTTQLQIINESLSKLIEREERKTTLRLAQKLGERGAKKGKKRVIQFTEDELQVLERLLVQADKKQR